jgi:transitional endoplasmic reticulum ATPase
VLAATNRPELVDQALLRPGRFDKIILVPLPDLKTRVKILGIHTRGKPLGSDVNLEKIALLADKFSGAEASAIANTAVSLVLHEYLSKYPIPEEATKHASEVQVMMRHFEEALKKIRIQRDTRPEERVPLAHYR